MVSNLSPILQFPLELENAIFKNLGGFYEPNFEKVQQNLNANEDDLLSYLGTYFPRSFAESYLIFEDLIYDKDIKNNYINKDRISILDIGGGTGGNILGLLWIMRESFKNFRYKKIFITSIDGNNSALNYQKWLIKRFFPTNTIIDSKRIIIITKENIRKKLRNVLIQNKFDVIMSSKFVNEFYREEFLFNWNEIPGNESNTLLEFLKKNFGFTWLTEAKIKKIDGNDAICIFYKNDLMLLKINIDEKKVILTYNGKIKDKFSVKIDKGNLKLYREKYTKNKGMYKIITEIVSNYLDKNGLFILTDVTDSIHANLFLPNIMNKEIIEYLNCNQKLSLILPLSCAFWFKNCRARGCFTRRDFSIIFNDASKVNNKLIHTNGISYKVFANKNTAKRILEQIEKQDCYKIYRGQTCRKGYSCNDINSEGQANAFSFDSI